MKGRAAAAAFFLLAALPAAFVAATLVGPSPAHPSSSPMAPEFPFVGPPWEEAPGQGDGDPEAGADGAEPPRPAGASWQAARTESYLVPVAGTIATGLLGLPAGEPTTLLVLAHPYAVSAEEYTDDLQVLADRGVLAVAMEFRGPRDAFKVAAGVEDTVAATLDLQARFHGLDRTMLYGHSMGGEVALLAAASAPPGTFDYVFVGAGVTDLESLWHSNLPIRPAIEHETGGTPSEVPEEYSARSPLDRVADLQAQGVDRFFVVHAAGDAPVPVDHAERLYEALEEGGLPVSYYVVTTDDDPAWCAPVLGVCPDTGPASHWAGRLDLMLPFIDNRIARLPDPAEPAVRGTYDGDSGTYDPSDVG